MSGIALLNEGGNTLDMGGNDGIMVLRKMNDKYFDGAGSDEAPICLKLRIYFPRLCLQWTTKHWHPYCR